MFVCLCVCLCVHYKYILTSLITRTNYALALALIPRPHPRSRGTRKKFRDFDPAELQATSFKGLPVSIADPSDRFESTLDPSIFQIFRKCKIAKMKTSYPLSGLITVILHSGEVNFFIFGNFSFLKIFRHRRGSNTRSSLYESDALPLGHCASQLGRKHLM